MNQCSIHDCPKCDCPAPTYREPAKSAPANSTMNSSSYSKTSFVWLAIFITCFSIVGNGISWCVRSRSNTCKEREAVIRKTPLTKSEAQWWAEHYDVYSECSLNGSIIDNRERVENINNKLRQLTYKDE